MESAADYVCGTTLYLMRINQGQIQEFPWWFFLGGGVSRLSGDGRA